ncbi:MAG: hypothetical protein C0519_04675 [Hyphomicrobium sp.]|nr:hypothetical protein [Hyphomicrobium sp.]PPD08509.1 MAG: hypothetical protein CTY28_03720 [Hyphomicrobium sp.]
MNEKLQITSPKRSRPRTGWEGFFPYYAGYPETFAKALLQSARLRKGATVLDPWNGSGTTTFAAAQLGVAAIGYDINPVMVVIARARMLALSEADSLEPLGQAIVARAKKAAKQAPPTDPIRTWFCPGSAAAIRSLEGAIRHQLVGSLTMTTEGNKIDKISSTAATFYVALFSVCRGLVRKFQGSNPTWLTVPKHHSSKVRVTARELHSRFIQTVREMAAALEARSNQGELWLEEQGAWQVHLGDSTQAAVEPGSIDLILTSPPYCTRIDYAAATRVELAVASTLIETTFEKLGRSMVGSTRVPLHPIPQRDDWGTTCHELLRGIEAHPSKASSGYYLKTHLDYFDKLSRSLDHLSASLKPGGSAIFVAQDSYYKDVHTDLPGIMTEMLLYRGLSLAQRKDFPLVRSMSSIHRHSRRYGRVKTAVEAVLCFRK